MITSLPILPDTGVLPKTIQGLGDNIQINQHGMPYEGEFGALLDDLHAALSETPAPALPGDAVAVELVAELQELPEGGKLLPLLQETLDAAVTQGLDGQQLLDAVASRGPEGQQLLDKVSDILESLQPAEVEQVAQSLSGLIQQFNSQISAATGIVPVESAVVSTPGKTDAVVPQGQLVELIQQQLRQQAAGTQLPDSNTSDAATLKQPVSETLPLTSRAGLDEALEQLQLQLQRQPQAPEGRQSDLALVMDAFRRQHADGVHRTSAENGRPESLAVAGGNVAAVTTGNGVSSSVLPTTSVQTPLGQANWGQAVGERIQWMVGQKMQGAQVKLNPANLGPMEVRIQVQNDQASVQFTAHHAGVREALEAALPRLKDMFEASGVELVDVDVSGHSFAEQQAAGEDGDGSARAGGAADVDIAPEIVLESEVASLEHAWRLDLFA